MRARALFFQGALASCAISAVVFTAGRLWYNDKATTGEYPWHQNQLDSLEEGYVADDRYSSNTLLLLLKTAPASILAAWFVVSLIAFGRDAFRLETIKSHFSAQK